MEKAPVKVNERPPVFLEKKGQTWYCRNCDRHYSTHWGGLWFCPPKPTG